MNNTYAVHTNQTFNDSLFFTGDSTRSLLTPLYASDASDYISDLSVSLTISPEKAVSEEICKPDCASQEANIDIHKKNLEKSSSNKYHDSITKVSVLEESKGSAEHETEIAPKQSISSSKSSSNASHSEPTEASFSLSSDESDVVAEYGNVKISWDEWMVRKAVDQMKNLQIKRQELNYKQDDERKKARKKEKIQEDSARCREEWLKEKTFLSQKKLREEEAQAAFEKLKKQQEADLIGSKSQAKYDEWLATKRRGMRVKAELKRQERREEKQKQHEKEENRVVAYNNWLQNVSSKKKPPTKSYGYCDGKLLGYHDLGASPTPDYINPVPWISSIPEAGKYERDRENSSHLCHRKFRVSSSSGKLSDSEKKHSRLKSHRT